MPASALCDQLPRTTRTERRREAGGPEYRPPTEASASSRYGPARPLSPYQAAPEVAAQVAFVGDPVVVAVQATAARTR